MKLLRGSILLLLTGLAFADFTTVTGHAVNDLGEPWDHGIVELLDGDSVVAICGLQDGNFGFSDVLTALGSEAKMVMAFRLDQNYPNPFNPITTIAYGIPEESQIHLSIYNIKGQLVETLVHQCQPAGEYSVQWDASRCVSSVYFYVLETVEFSKIHKMILLK